MCMCVHVHSDLRHYVCVWEWVCESAVQVPVAALPLAPLEQRQASSVVALGPAPVLAPVLALAVPLEPLVGAVRPKPGLQSPVQVHAAHPARHQGVARVHPLRWWCPCPRTPRRSLSTSLDDCRTSSPWQSCRSRTSLCSLTQRFDCLKCDVCGRQEIYAHCLVVAVCGWWLLAGCVLPAVFLHGRGLGRLREPRRLEHGFWLCVRVCLCACVQARAEPLLLREQAPFVAVILQVRMGAVQGSVAI